MLIILSGPPAAGKTTIGEALAKEFPKSAYFSVDTIRHFVKGGYVPPWEDTEESKQGKLASSITKDIIRNYDREGYDVIIDDVMGDNEVLEYKNESQDVYAFLLLPTLNTLKDRDQLRGLEQRMGSRIDELYPNFINTRHTELKVIDSTNLTVEQTTEIILKEVKNPIATS